MEIQVEHLFKHQVTCTRATESRGWTAVPGFSIVVTRKETEGEKLPMSPLPPLQEIQHEKRHLAFHLWEGEGMKSKP